MRDTSPLAVIWRRKWIIISTFIVFVVTAAIISKSLQKVYSTHATLIVALPADTQTFDSVQASQAVARSYADVLSSPNIADVVARRLGADPDQLMASTSFDPVPETQLLQMTAEDPDPARAKLVADTFAAVFIQYARANLQDITKATVKLADPAPLPEQAARPKPTLYVLVAAILGLAVGLALAFLRDRLDHRLRTFDDVESQFDVPILARVPRRGRSETSQVAFQEAYRVLRTNLRFASAGGRLRSIAVTSGSEGEGKTTAIMELALVSAEVGLKVLVVDADFRRPTLERTLMPDRDEPLWPGLSNYLVEAATIDQVIFPTGRTNISIVPAGPLPPSPSALLESRRARTAISDFLGKADLVLVDCPPLSVGADASVMSRFVDAVVFVVDLGSATDRSVRDGLRQLKAVHAPVLGLMLNRDPSAEAKSYDYYLAPKSARGKGRGIEPISLETPVSEPPPDGDGDDDTVSAAAKGDDKSSA